MQVKKTMFGVGREIIPDLAFYGMSMFFKNNTADLIYALDMFHMIEDANSFLNELNRIIKKDGILILEAGHQKRERAREKVNNSGKWSIFEESERHMRCIPVK